MAGPFATSLCHAALRATLLLVALCVEVVSGQPVVASCPNAVNVQTNTTVSVSGSLSSDALRQLCPVMLFQPPNTAGLAGQLSVNIRGDFTYLPPASVNQLVDVATVDVTCVNTAASPPQQVFLCRLSVVVVVALPVTLPPTPPPPPSPSPDSVPPCPNVYYYTSPVGVTASFTLRNQIGQIGCDVGRAFRMNRPASLGSVLLVLNGDFTYSAPGQETWDDYGFDMYCFQTLVCRGTAFVLVSAQATLAPAPTDTPAASGATSSGVGPTTTTAAPPVFIPTTYQTCQGTCASNAWKVVPTLPAMWDVTTDENGGFSHVSPRKDGRPVGSIELQWDQGALVVRSYGVIGNMAPARFPTFEAFAWAKPGEGLTSSEVVSKVAGTSLPFDPTCLDNQPAWGMGEEVWRWYSVANKTGTVGRRYASGATWYHKFGGKHVGCDTIQQSCKYAPFLTPRTTQNPDAAGGVWSVAIDDCDVTWTGRFSFNSLLTTRTLAGDLVFKTIEGHLYQATIYSESVKPVSWLEPSKGYLSSVQSKSMLVDLSPVVKVTQDPSTALQFSSDLRYFTYLNENGDVSFGMNLLIFPVLIADAAYAPDRHVTGFRWISQSWTRPNNVECPTCIGASSTCAVSPNLGDGSFLSSTFPQGNCTSPRVLLFPGPRMTPGVCLANRMHILNRAGFSMPRGCNSAFQNLTIRGTAVGSSRLARSSSGVTTLTPDSISFEGTMRLQLLMDNGQKPTVDITVSRYVAVSTVDSNLRGRIAACRASAYWPVLDPLGSSLPDQPSLYAINNVPATNVLCMDPLDRMFGTQGWALVVYDVVGYDRSSVVVESLTVTYPELGPGGLVYLIGNDPVTGQRLTSLPNAMSSWWVDTHPFFNFRDVTSSRLANQSITYGADVAPIDVGGDASFMLTPGAIGISTDVTVTCVARAIGPSPDGGTTPGPFVGRITMSVVLHIDPTLRALRTVVTAGASPVAPGSNASMVAVVVAGGLIFALVAGGLMFALGDAAEGGGSTIASRFIPRMRKLVLGAQRHKVAANGTADSGAAAAAKPRRPIIGEAA